MSGSLTPIPAPGFATAPLSSDELVMCRRFMGYPALGGISSGEQSWRFFAAYGFNEWRFQNMSPAELAQVRSYLSNCTSLEQAICGASDNLDTDQAAVWKRNRSEVADRVDLYNYWRQQLCAFFGAPVGPGVYGQAGRIIV